MIDRPWDPLGISWLGVIFLGMGFVGLAVVAGARVAEGAAAVAWVLGAVACAALWYWVTAVALNHTIVEATADRLAVRHGPLPLADAFSLPREAVAQVYVKQRNPNQTLQALSRRAWDNRVDPPTYQVWVATTTGQAVELLSGLDRVDEALFVEQELEDVLGLEDVDVPWTVRREASVALVPGAPASSATRPSPDASSGRSVACPRCGSRIRVAEGVDAVGCGDCHAVFRLRRRVEAPVPPARVPARSRIPTPWRYRSRVLPDGVRVSRWNVGWTHVGGATLVLAWLAPVAYLWTVLIDDHEVFTGAVFVAVVPTLIGLVCAYFPARGFVNRTSIEVASGRLTIRTGPLPTWGAKPWSAACVSQVFVLERPVARDDRSAKPTYSVVALLPGGGEDELLVGLPTRDEALFMEQEIERGLGIEDRAILGEVPRD